MLERITALQVRHPREGTPRLPDAAEQVTASFLRELEAVRQTFSDIAQTDVAHKVFASPKWMMRVLGTFHPFLLRRKKIPLAAFFSDNWIHYPEKALSVAQAAVLEFVHESQTVIGDKVSLLNVADLFGGRLAELIFNEREENELGQGPVARSLQHAVKQGQEAGAGRNLRQNLAEMSFFMTDESGTMIPSTFPQLLQPVFAVDPIRDRVIGILADNLALACGVSAGI